MVDVASRLVNALTPGLDRGHELALPDGAERVLATAEALGGNGRRTPTVTPRQATSLAAYAAQMRRVFDAAEAGDLSEATRVLNRMLKRTGARPQLDPLPDGDGWHVHFHGST
ncbi:MAG: ABATE domain-containing protein, partial [Nocardioides sp.]